MKWVDGKELSWKRHPELEEVFNDFMFNLEFKGAFDAEIVENKGEDWRRYQTILCGMWNLIKLRYSNPFSGSKPSK